MLADRNLRDELNKFAKYVISQSRSNLTRGGKKLSSKLYNSLGFDISSRGTSMSLTFKMDSYGKFQDKGVKGKDPSRVSPNAKIRGQQAPNSPYKFGTGSTKGWGKFVKRMSQFAKLKGIRFRNKKGEFAKGGFDSVGYVIASNIYNRGIRPSMFFTKPFENAFRRLPQELIDAYSVGIEKQLNVTIKEK